MNKILIIAAAVFLIVSCNSKNQNKPTLTTDSLDTGLTWPENLPKYDHIVIIMEENKDYTQIEDKNLAPYINNVLRSEGANFTNMFGEEHYSQGNYFWLFSGDNQNVGFIDVTPTVEKNHNPQYPFTTPNIASQLIEGGYSFSGYSEALPYIGSDTIATYSANSKVQIYGRKHVPWVSFANVPDSLNKRYIDLPADYNDLPTVSFIIPDLNHDMHNGPDSLSIPTGDAWLKKHIDPYYQWAKNNNSLLIVTFDENDDYRKILGLTDPDPNNKPPNSVLVDQNSTDTLASDYQNKVVTIFAGAHIKPGNYPEGKGITHVNILRTIEAMYGLPKAGKQQINAANYGISDDYIITDVFKSVPSRKLK